jgi:N-methylhydantoinase B
MVAQPNAALALINQQIMWNRLIAVVEEQAQTMLRTAFSTPVREAGDLSAGVFDRQGRMLAQAVTGTPGHVNSMANAVRHFLDVYPLVVMKPGDHFITNDPWLTSGHLHDITVVSPSFYRGEAVGLFANTIHVVDIGGLGMGPDGRQVFEEGLAIPIMSLAREGRMNEDLLHLVRANVREPLQVVGDIYACAACNDEGSRRLIEMMDEFEIANLDRLGETIVDAARAQCRFDDLRGGHPCRFRRHVAGIELWHQRRLQLLPCLHRIRRQMPSGAGRAKQRGLARSDHRQRTGRLRSQCQAAMAGSGAPHRRPHAT